jgi:hypothetical protein
MKKSLICFLFLLAFQVNAQVNIGKLKPESPQTGTGFNWDRVDTPLYIDYSYLNNDNNGTGWHINDYYNASDSAINFAGVAYDNICGYYDYVNYNSTIVSATDLGFDSVYPSNALLRYDSVQAYIAHENNSGVADTIIAELRLVNNSNNTISTTVLWADTLITSVGLSPGNDWSNGASSFSFLRFPIGYSTNPGEKAGVVIRYLNYNKQDTFGLAAGFVTFGMGSASAFQSNYKNSFLRFPPFAPSISRNSDFQMISGGYLPGQNWSIIPRVQVYNTTLGLQSAKGDLKVLTLYPNPANSLLNIVFESSINTMVDLMIVDAQGKIVVQMKRSTGQNNRFNEQIDCSNLAAGLYSVIINQNNQIYSQRVVIAGK